jgi:hypothetical protein
MTCPRGQWGINWGLGRGYVYAVSTPLRVSTLAANTSPPSSSSSSKIGSQAVGKLCGFKIVMGVVVGNKPCTFIWLELLPAIGTL